MGTELDFEGGTAQVSKPNKKTGHSVSEEGVGEEGTLRAHRRNVQPEKMGQFLFHGPGGHKTSRHGNPGKKNL